MAQEEARRLRHDEPPVAVGVPDGHGHKYEADYANGYADPGQR